MNKFNLKIKQRFYERLVIRIKYAGKFVSNNLKKFSVSTMDRNIDKPFRELSKMAKIFVDAHCGSMTGWSSNTARTYGSLDRQ